MGPHVGNQGPSARQIRMQVSCLGTINEEGGGEQRFGGRGGGRRRGRRSGASREGS